MKFAIHNLCTFQVIHNTICIYILLTKRSTTDIFLAVSSDFRGIDIDFSIWQYLPGRYHHTIYIIVILVYCSPDRNCNDNSLLMLSYAIIVSSLYYIQIMILREPKPSFWSSWKRVCQTQPVLYIGSWFRYFITSNCIRSISSCVARTTRNMVP